MSDRPRRNPARPARPSLRNQLLFVCGILVLAAGAFYTALVVATQIDQVFFPGNEITLGGGLARLPGIDKGNDPATELGGGRINVLVMGLDRRPREGNAATRTDTMFVMTIDPSTRTARGLAMPRDLYVDIPSKTGNTSFKERINTAYAYGENNGYQGGGAALAKTVVEKLLGIKLNYYVVIDFEGFKQVIDLLGGIDVDVPAPGVNDPYYSETELLGDYYPCIFKAGTHHMNGSDALCYARTRRNSNDLERIGRQQRVILAVMDKMTQLNALADLDNVRSLWKRYKNTISTDISDLQIPGFASLAASIDQNQIAFLTTGAATTPYTTPQGAAVLIPSPEGIKQIVDAFVSDNKLTAEAAVVEVQNGTATTGLATKAVEYLTSHGIHPTSLSAANAAEMGHVRTEIIDYSGKRYTAERIASWLSVPKDRIRAATATDMALRTGQADVLVILGDDAKLESAVAQQPR